MPDVIDTIIAEAGGEGDKGITAAVWSIVQRAAARGQTLDQVIKSGFDGYSNPGSGSRKAQQSPAMRNKVQGILTGVQNGSIPNPVPGADHFLSGTKTPSWAKNMTPVATIGGHRFYASGNVPKSAQGTALQAINSAAPNNAVSKALGYAPQRASARQVAPIPASVDDRVNARNLAPRNDPFGYVRTSASPAPNDLQQALNNRVSQVAPVPASVDDRVNARNLAPQPAVPSPITASDRARGNVNIGVGLPQKTGSATSWGQFYNGITPATAKSPIPATADDRVTARNAAPNGNQVVANSIAAVNATPKSTALQSALDRLAATKAATAQTISPAYNQVSQAQKLAMSAVPAVAPTYSASNPLVAAAQSAQQTASQRLAPSPRDVNLGWSDPQLGQIATSAPRPMPTIPRQSAPTQLVAQRPNVAVPDTQGLYGVPMTANIAPQAPPSAPRPIMNPVAQALAYQQPAPQQQALQQIAVAQALTGRDPLSGRVYDGTNAADRAKMNEGGRDDRVAQSLL